jgi:hypothetical protein
MKLPKICLSNTLIFVCIIIIIGIYFYKGYKEGFTPPSTLQTRFGNNTSSTPPTSVTSCAMMTSYGETTCNNTTTTSNQKCLWNSSPTNLKGSAITTPAGGICKNA